MHYIETILEELYNSGRTPLIKGLWLISSDYILSKRERLVKSGIITPCQTFDHRDYWLLNYEGIHTGTNNLEEVISDVIKIQVKAMSIQKLNDQESHKLIWEE